MKNISLFSRVGIFAALLGVLFTVQPATAERNIYRDFLSSGGAGGAEISEPTAPEACPIRIRIPTCQNFWETSHNFLSAFCCECSGTIGGEPSTDHPACDTCCNADCLVWDFESEPPTLIGNACDGCTAPMFPSCG